MTLSNLIRSIRTFIPIKEENSQTILYAANCRCNEFKFVKQITDIVTKFPTVGSNAFINNWNNYKDPLGIYKLYRLSLNDFEIMKQEDIDLRIKKILDSLKEPEKLDEV